MTLTAELVRPQQTRLTVPIALRVSDLVVSIDGRPAVDRVSFSITLGRTFCLVGESGCGKSLTCLALAGQLQRGIVRTGGSVDIAGERPAANAAFPAIAMIHQDAVSSLDPIISVGRQIAEPLQVHGGLSSAAARAEALRLLDQVGIPDAKRRYEAYPHELSGGMNQRVSIARALACRPAILLADEPTTALDVTVQAQILDLLAEVQAETGLSLLFVTHDLGVVAEIGDEMAVMYAGRIVESGAVAEVFAAPQHPYTAGLLACLPSLTDRRETLAAIPGVVPGLAERDAGCSFAARCSRAEPACRKTRPPLNGRHGSPAVACFHPHAKAA